MTIFGSSPQGLLSLFVSRLLRWVLEMNVITMDRENYLPNASVNPRGYFELRGVA